MIKELKLKIENGKNTNADAAEAAGSPDGL